MAATLGAVNVYSTLEKVVEETYYTTLEPGATVTKSYTAVDGIGPSEVHCLVTERPTSRDPVSFAWDESANDTTNDSVALQFDTVAGGDLTGAQVKVVLVWPQGRAARTAGTAS